MEKKGETLTLSRMLRGVLVAFVALCVVFASVPAQAIEVAVGNTNDVGSKSIAANDGEKSLEEEKSPEADGDKQEAAGGDETKSPSEPGEDRGPDEQVDETKGNTDSESADKPEAGTEEDAASKGADAKGEPAAEEERAEEKAAAGAAGAAALSAEAAAPSVSVLTHVQNRGWDRSWVTGGRVAGSTGSGLRMEAMRLRLEGPGAATGTLRYRAHVQNVGWQGWVSGDGLCGTSGRSLRVEALQVSLEGELADSYDVVYRVHAQNVGWMGWARNGECAGTAGKSLRLEAIQVALVRRGESAPAAPGQATASPFLGAEEVRLAAHVQNVGWMAPVGGGRTAGTTGRSLRVEAVRAEVAGLRVPGGVEVAAHVQNVGWQGWRGDGRVAGTTGRSLRVEAVKMRLTGEAADEYDLYYRAHVQNFGWLAWAKDGEEAGSTGLSLRVEGFQTRLVRKGGAAPSNAGASFAYPMVSNLSIGYATCSSGAWSRDVMDGATSGTTGKGIALTGMKVSLLTENSNLNGNVRYRAHVQNSGWEGWCSNGGIAGQANSSNRMEAIQIKVDGSASTAYNVWYRVHVQDYGWLGWAKNGASAGTVGLGKRIEAVQIRLMSKSSNAPGSTYRPFVDGQLRAALGAAKGTRAVTSFGGHSASKGAVNALNSAINGIRNRGYDVGFIMMDLASHKGVAYNCDALFYGASSIKAPYIGSVVSRHPDSVVRYAHDMTETLFYSWDYNYKQVLAAYGKGPMRTWCEESGARSSIAESLPWANYSARDLARLWARNYQLFSESSEGEQFGRWCERPNISTIHSTLGGKYRTRSKAGWIDDGGGVVPGVNGGGRLYRVSDDGGIVYARNGAYVMAIMSSVPANHDMLNGLTSAIDRAHSEM